jgi:Xaa-Pro dipeptidase
MKIIRQERLDLVLPGAMRDNNVDPYHAGRPCRSSLSGLGVRIRMTVQDIMCYAIFTDLGEQEIEWAVLGAGRGDPYPHTIWAPEADLGAFVAERDPKSIAANMSAGIPVSNGMSHVGYQRLTERIGEKYTARLISAEDLIDEL